VRSIVGSPRRRPLRSARPGAPALGDVITRSMLWADLGRELFLRVRARRLPTASVVPYTATARCRLRTANCGRPPRRRPALSAAVALVVLFEVPTRAAVAGLLVPDKCVAKSSSVAFGAVEKLISIPGFLGSVWSLLHKVEPDARLKPVGSCGSYYFCFSRLEGVILPVTALLCVQAVPGRVPTQLWRKLPTVGRNRVGI
jgi:hypothetical protein